MRPKPTIQIQLTPEQRQSRPPDEAGGLTERIAPGRFKNCGSLRDPPE
jgi:hypothetical protein